MLEQIIEADRKNRKYSITNINANLAKSLAARLSIKAGTRLTTEEMESISNNLFSCNMPEVAPDGSNILTIISLSELEKLLKEKGK